MDTDRLRDNRRPFPAQAKPELLHSSITEQIIGAAMEVNNTLGFGFLEKVYENALAIELRARGLVVEQQKEITVRYKSQVVGQYVADLVVGELVVVELKSVSQITADHEAQLLNYLKGTDLKVGLILNFGRRLDWKRMVF